MKRTICLLITALTLTVSATLTMAGPPPGGWKVQKAPVDLAQLDSNLSAGQVCEGCDSTSNTATGNNHEGMVFCQDGAPNHCPSCDSEAKLVRNGPVSKGKLAVEYESEHGAACLSVKG